MKRLALSLMLLLSLFPLCRAQYDKDVFMFRGRQALSEGRYADAISQFNILSGFRCYLLESGNPYAEIESVFYPGLSHRPGCHTVHVQS